MNNEARAAAKKPLVSPSYVAHDSFNRNHVTMRG